MGTRANFLKVVLVTTIGIGIGLFIPRIAGTHCDTLDGPVVTTAKTALEKGDVTPVLKWVSKEYENEIRDLFKKTLAVRGKSPEAKELADMYFFETLVRLHRAGEGAPYTGLKPAGAVEPPVAAADKALEMGNVDGLVKNITDHTAAAIRERFNRVIETKKHMDESVEAGREYVEAYIEFTHYVERLHLTAHGAPGHHGEPEGKEPEHKH
jgi:hypothetical protein